MSPLDGDTDGEAPIRRNFKQKNNLVKVNLVVDDIVTRWRHRG